MIIDAHTHFYDSSRPQGIPWPRSDDQDLCRIALPEKYRLCAPRPLFGVIAVEASPWLEDNQWVLDLAAENPLIIGFVGNLPLGAKEFSTHLDRFAANPLFRGIRAKHAQLASGLHLSDYVANLRLLAERDLTLDLYGGPNLLTDVIRLSKILPTLRIVINHVANVKIDGKTPDSAWGYGIRAAASHDRVSCKVSALVEGTGHRDGSAPADMDFYRPVLDTVWEAFGEDRLIYGSNWPVSARYASPAVVQSIVFDYFAEKGSSALRKAFHTNAAENYRIPQLLDH